MGTLIGLVVAVATMLTGRAAGSDGPEVTRSSFLALWKRSDWAGMSRYVDKASATFAASGPEITAGLGASSETHRLEKLNRDGSRAAASIASRYVLPGIGDWDVRTTINLADRSGHWLLEWAPAAIDPMLRYGDLGPHSLPAAVTTGLQQMMAEVRSSGTAAATGLPTGTHAKTGPAEYGTGMPQPTDAWLIGYRGDIAFAMVLQGTGNGDPTDGPIVARFLDAFLPGA